MFLRTLPIPHCLIQPHKLAIRLTPVAHFQHEVIFLRAVKLVAPFLAKPLANYFRGLTEVNEKVR